jgi:hypothetical protein
MLYLNNFHTFMLYGNAFYDRSKMASVDRPFFSFISVFFSFLF